MKKTQRKLKTQRGWSVPLNTILLMAILGQTYVYGWKVLVIVLISAVGIALGMLLSRRYLSPERELHFWFVSNLEFSALANLVQYDFGGKLLVHDHEGDWEWLEAVRADESTRLHITRKHKPGAQDHRHPVKAVVTCKGYALARNARESIAPTACRLIKNRDYSRNRGIFWRGRIQLHQ
jgi:hypothetical protein